MTPTNLWSSLLPLWSSLQCVRCRAESALPSTTRSTQAGGHQITTMPPSGPFDPTTSRPRGWSTQGSAALPPLLRRHCF
jgi:hypothetical protein